MFPRVKEVLEHADYLRDFYPGTHPMSSLSIGYSSALSAGQLWELH